MAGSHRFLALLRGINVGKAKRVAMADLRALLADLGYGDVRTHLNSGNAIFSAPPTSTTQLAAAIEAAIENKLGFSSKVVVLDGDEVDSIITGNPLLDVADNHSRLQVCIPRARDSLASLEPLLERDWVPDRLAIGSRVAYLWAPDGLLASPVINEIERALRGGEVTTRTWRTFSRLAEMMKSDA